MKVYEQIASLIQARQNCQSHRDGGLTADASHWRGMADTHKDATDAVVRDYLPSGSGFDNGTRLDWDRSTAERLVFLTAFHHMNEVGFYDGWTEHTVTVRPTLHGQFRLSISGRDRNEIKDYVAESFDVALRQEV